jgi:hypothetical protein
MTECKSLKSVSRKFGLTEEYLERLVARQLIDCRYGENLEYLIPTYSFPRLELLSKDPQYREQIFKEEKNFLYEHHPELKRYLEYHDTIDRFAWLIKLRFADKEMLKSRRFRIDGLFQLFLKELAFDQAKVKRNLVTRHASESKFRFHLFQGWYNEISAGYPFSQDFNIGSSLKRIEDDSELILFPSWKIIKYYYSIYSYYNALVFTENSDIRTVEHRKSSLYFNRHQLAKFSKYLFKFPFNVYYKNGERRKSHLEVIKKEWQYSYAQCPRRPNKNILELEKDYINDLRKRYRYDQNIRGREEDKITILDLLYSFRVWSNYQGIDTIAKLKYGGLLLFLERNLYTISFFSGGLVELMAIAFLGEKKYRAIFNDFYFNYIRDNELLFDKWYKIPQVVRFRIYRHLELLTRKPRGFDPPNKDDLILI